MKNALVYALSGFLITTYSFVACMFSGGNSTIIVGNSGSLMPYVSPYRGTRYDIPAVIAGSYSQIHNRKERRAQGQKKQPTHQKSKKVTIYDEVQTISDKIYKDLGYEDRGNCCLNFVDGIVYSTSKLMAMQYSSEDAVIRSLQKIDKDIQETSNAEEIIKRLAERNDFFQILVNRLVRERKQKEITGSTIDEFFGKSRMFPLSDVLSRYIGEQVKEMILAKYLSFERKVRPYYKQREITLIDSLLCTYTRTIDSDIHAVALKGHEYPIDPDSIMISNDNRYMKTMDMDILGVDEKGTTIIWDLLTGERCDNVKEESIVWLEKKLYEKGYCPVANIEFRGKDRYHVSLCAGPLFYTSCDKATIPTLYLYKRPTLVSFLCQNILSDKRDDNIELDALLNSDVVQNVLKGFPQKNLISAIRKTQEENRAKGENCLF